MRNEFCCVGHKILLNASFELLILGAVMHYLRDLIFNLCLLLKKSYILLKMCFWMGWIVFLLVCDKTIQINGILESLRMINWSDQLSNLCLQIPNGRICSSVKLEILDSHLLDKVIPWRFGSTNWCVILLLLRLSLLVVMNFHTSSLNGFSN